ncbi:sialate O-acetylesterase [Telmatobacter bradus]|uniref:sialate O-acetylesterase n=1 Tax=Telmatobacter bradus TaxID=474953 RepID=UPI003B4303B6
MKKSTFNIVVLFLLVIFALRAESEIRLPNVLGSHMVLQRNRPIHLWGWASPGEVVTVDFHGVRASSTTDGLGHWSLYLPAEPAGGPYALTVSSSNSVNLTDVLVGDVWFASGQSNMQLPLMGFPNNATVTNGLAEIQNATHATIRLLHIKERSSYYPLDDIEGNWTNCTPETAASFSAAAYFFGREIEEKEHVPVGLIDSTWGGTVAEAWLSLEAIASDSSLMPIFATWAAMTEKIQDTPAIEAKEKREDAAARASGQTPLQHVWHPDPLSWQPAGLYNAMVNPFISFPICGVIWYQGESNSALDRAAMYQRIFPALISDWRRHWKEGNFPFIYTQISSFTSTPQENWAVIREAQRRTLSLANTAMAVTIDIGNPDNVHPADKQDVGHRLALAARAISYGERIEYSGPLYRQASIKGNSIRVDFDQNKNGLVAKGGRLTGFEIADADHGFVPAMARIDAGGVIVSASGMANPKYVRYGWSNAPVMNLFNGNDLPASPFTSEDTIPAP